MVNAYIAERYDDNLEIDWNDYLKEYGLTCYMTSYGFVTYKLQGDAAIIYDIYVKPEYREKGHPGAWKLHNYVKKLAELAKKRVMIGFSQYLGQNHMAGLKAMKVAGFSPAFKTDEEFVFVKGI